MSEMHVTDQPAGRRVPTLSLRWRLTISLDESDVDRDQMATIIGVDPSTISRWTNGHFKRPPTKAVLKEWAMATGVDVEWLITGQSTPDSGTPARDSAQGAANTTRFSGESAFTAETPVAAVPRGIFTPPRRVRAA